MTGKLTEKEYWDSIYAERAGLSPIPLDGARNHCARKIYSIKRDIGFDGKNVLEIGGGGSAWLAYLSGEYPNATFTCLDYSVPGVREIEEYAKRSGKKNLFAMKGDFFEESESRGKFDFVYSHGVVEHFLDLAGALRSHSEYLSEEGKMLTIIPNMSGILGILTKKWNRAVFDIHVPHNLESFVKGHEDAKLKIINSGYLCSNNFGVLSSCFGNKQGASWELYKSLTRFSKMIWFFEEKFVELPATHFFSPYIYAVSEKQ